MGRRRGGLPWTAKRLRLANRKVTRVLVRRGPERFALPPRFASGRVGASPGRASPPVPQRQALPADREARRRPSRHAKRGGRVMTFLLPNPMSTSTF